MLSIKASTVQVYNCGNPRTRQCGGRLSFQVVRHLSCTCIYVVLYIYSVLFLLFCIVYRKKKSFLFLPKGRAFVTIQNGWNNRISYGCVYAQIRSGLGMHPVTYSNHDTVLFLLIVPIKGRFVWDGIHCIYIYQRLHVFLILLEYLGNLVRFSIYKGWNFPFLLGDILNIPLKGSI